MKSNLVRINSRSNNYGIEGLDEYKTLFSDYIVLSESLWKLYLLQDLLTLGGKVGSV